MQKVKKESQRQEEELELLRKKAQEQEKQLNDVNMKAAELIQKQAQMAQNLIEQQNLHAAAIAQAQAQGVQAQTVQNPQPQADNDIKDTLDELSMDFSELDENEAAEKLKNWIENT